MSTEKTSNTESVSRLDAFGRDWLEKRLGRLLRDDEEITILTRPMLDATRRQELLGELERMQRDVRHFQEANGIRSEDVEGIVDEAVEYVLSRRSTA